VWLLVDLRNDVWLLVEEAESKDAMILMTEGVTIDDRM
jgi:hypothetical protein